MALTQTKNVNSVSLPPLSTKKLKLSPGPSLSSNAVAPANVPRVVTITAEQFLALASRLQQQQQEKGNGGKPLIISLPKNVKLPVSTQKLPVSNKNSSNGSVQKVTNSPSKPNEGPTAVDASSVPAVPEPVSLPTCQEEVVNQSPSIVEISNSNDSDPTGVVEVGTTTVYSSPRTESSRPLSNSETNDGCTERRNHFLKSGLLKGSARTTPMPLLCMRKRNSRRTSSGGSTGDEPDPALASSSEAPQSGLIPTLNNAALPFDADDDMFINEDSESHSSAGNPPVWLSIMQDDETGHFSGSAGADDNDDDLLLDPSRLAAQLASIHRQVASQYSFSS